MDRKRSFLPLFLTCLLLTPVALGAGVPVFNGTSSGNTQLMDSSMPARQFDPLSLLWLVDLPDIPDGERSLRCTVHAQDGTKPRKGVKINMTAELLDANGDPVGSSETLRKRTDRNGDLAVTFDLESLNLTDGLYVAAVDVVARGTKRATRLATECVARSRKPCIPGDTTLCLLGDDRFQVEVEWDDGVGSGQGMVLSSLSGEGFFYFFGPGNDDLFVQLLDNCRQNGHYWVFYAATTDVEFELTVTDTETGASKVYDNPLGGPAPAILDTAAFATCP